MRQVLTHSTQLGRILAGRRKALKRPQREVAAKLAISQNRLSELEDDAGRLTLERLLALVNLLGLELVIQDKSSERGRAKTEW
jgi:HTH-type transcriptional regulator/antitoxin HipB